MNLFCEKKIFTKNCIAPLKYLHQHRHALNFELVFTIPHEKLTWYMAWKKAIWCFVIENVKNSAKKGMVSENAAAQDFFFQPKIFTVRVLWFYAVHRKTRRKERRALNARATTVVNYYTTLNVIAFSKTEPINVIV